VFIDAFIFSILRAALVFSWFLLLIIPVRSGLRYPYSHQSWYQSTYWSNTYWELPPPSSQNKVVSGGRPEGSKRHLKCQSATWSQAPLQ
jgi:hypothetical protein